MYNGIEKKPIRSENGREGRKFVGKINCLRTAGIKGKTFSMMP